MTFKDEAARTHPDPERREQRRALKPFWQRVFEDEHKEIIEDSYPSRARVSWRLTRFLAIAQGRIDVNESLASISPEQAAKPVKGVPLVPPRPSKFLSHHAIHRNALVYTHFVEAIKDIAERQVPSIMVSRPMDLLKGSHNLWGILTEELCHQAYLSFDEILFVEDHFIMRTLDLLVKTDRIRTTNILRSQYQFTHPEIDALVTCSRSAARRMTEFDQEEQRAIMVLKLQDHQRRAKKQFNMREELQSLKQEALVIGLTKTSPSGFEDIFGKVVDMAQPQAPRQIEAHSTPNTPPYQIPTQIQDTEDEEDDE